MQGFVYPLKLDNKGVKVTDDYAQLVKNAIVSGILTKQEERVMRPEYGLESQEFDVVSDIVTTLAKIRDTVTLALEGYPDVSFELRGSINDSGLLDVLVTYTSPDIAPESVTVTI